MLILQYIYILVLYFLDYRSLRNTSRMHIKLEKSVNWKFPFDLNLESNPRLLFEFESNLESNWRIVIYSVNVKFLLIAIYEFCYFVGVRRRPYCMQGCNSI